MEVPYFPVEDDDFHRSKEYIESLRGTLKQTKDSSADDEEDTNDQWLDEIIQLVFTDGQKATFKIYADTLSKKNKLTRGDVRSLFIDPKSMRPHHVQSLKLSTEKSKSHLDVQDHSDGEEEIKRVSRKGHDPKDRKVVDSFSKLKVSGNEQVDGNNSGHSCQVHYLGWSDLSLVRTFAETEILTVFRQNGNIKFSRLQSKRKPKDVGVFGVALQTLLERDLKKNPNLRVPLFVSTLISLLESYVDEEGILRISGSLSRIKETVQILESDDNYLPTLQTLLPHDLSGLLKQFLRDLPSPIFTLNWLDAFCKAVVISDDGTKLHAYQTLLCLLPDVNRATLQLVIKLLGKICKSSNNRMTLENVSMTIGPSLFLIESSNRSSSNIAELDSLGKFVGVTNYLLKNIDKIWMVPTLLLQQVRQINIEKEDKWKKKRSSEWIGKALQPGTPSSDRKKRSSERRSNTSSHAENTLENVFVHSCHPDYPSRCLKISDSMTAADILQKFNKFKEPYFLLTSSLFESGGSIGHMLLDPTSNISHVLEENPHARFFFFKQSPKSLILQWPQFY